MSKIRHLLVEADGRVIPGQTDLKYDGRELVVTLSIIGQEINCNPKTVSVVQDLGDGNAQELFRFDVENAFITKARSKTEEVAEIEISFFKD